MIGQIIGSISPLMWVSFVAVVAVFIAFIALNWVNKSIGIGFAIQLFKMKSKLNKNKVLLKILVKNGRPQFKSADIANIIEYTYKENGKTKQGMVKFDYYSTYYMFNDIKVLECDPHDILPRNPFVNTSLTINGDILKKNIVDSSKEDVGNENLKRYIKLALPLIIAFGAILILYSSNQGDQVAKLTNDLVACYAQIPKEAVITAVQ